MRGSPNGEVSQPAQKSCAASALPVMWNPRVWRLRGSPRHWARASVFSRRPRSECNPTAACRCWSAPIITAKVTSRHSRKSLRPALAFRLSGIEIIEGDTDQVPFGSGTFGSRSIAVGGSAIDRAAMKIIEKGKRIAAHLLEASEGDITFTGGIFSIAGTDRRISLPEVARAAHIPASYPSGWSSGFKTARSTILRVLPGAMAHTLAKSRSIPTRAKSV